MYIDKICKSYFINNEINYEIELTENNDFRFIPAIAKIVKNKQSHGIIPITIDEMIISTDKYKMGILGKVFDVKLILYIINDKGETSLFSFKTKFKIDEFQTIYPNNVNGKIRIAPIQVQIPSYTNIYFEEMYS